MELEFTEELTDSFAEDLIWTNRVRPFLEGTPENVITICAYGFTEMMNNAKDHSGADSVFVRVSSSDTIQIADLGVGIFNQLVSKLGLEDVRHAVFELTKGKLTTDPDRQEGLDPNDEGSLRSLCL
jgi:signal transduction histidine kinase